MRGSAAGANISRAAPASTETPIARWSLLVPALMLPAGAALVGGAGSAVAPVLLALAAILAGAKLGGDVAVRLGQPAVLGELVAGVVLGNLDLVGVGWFRSLTSDPSIGVLAQLGVLILLFEVGLESTVREMLRVGAEATLVAVLGVVTPFALGWGVGALLRRSAVTMTATS